ncbi:MAG: hypothetical protein CSA70_03090 [Rhodobacterales bacterium]|nr:MAG: hypothetical protein CSA70_03090 [Rhodobacterales bacterium]
MSVLGLVLPLAGCLGDGTGKGVNFLSAMVPLDNPEARQARKAPRVKPTAKASRLRTLAKPGAKSGAKPGKVLTELSLAKGRVVVKGPRGYCIDGGSVEQRNSGGFALLGSCEILTSGKSGASVEPAVMTVQVQPRGLQRNLPDAATLAGVLASDKVLAREDGDGITVVHLEGGEDHGVAVGDPKYWRATIMINGHPVGLAVYGPKGSPVAGRHGRGLILGLAETLRAASPENPVPQARNAAVEKPVKSGRTAAQKGGLKKLFPKIFQ